MDPFEYLRMQGLFRPQGQIPPYRPMDEIPRPSGNLGIGVDAGKNPYGRIFQPEQPMTPTEGLADDPLALIKAMYTPDNKYSDLYYKTLSEMPQREHIGIGRKILASIAGAGGGPQMADTIMNAPYNQKMADWTARIKAIEPGLSLERYGNANERMLANEAAGRVIQDRRADIAAKKEESERIAREAKTASDKENTEIRRSRATAYIYKQNHPNHVYREDDEGYVYSVDPQSNKAEYLLDPEGNYIKSSHLTDQQKADLQLKNARTLIKEREASAEKLEGVRQTNRTANIQKRADVSPTGRNAAGTVTETTTTLEKDEKGNPVARKTRTTRLPATDDNVKVTMQYKSKDGVTHTILVPKSKVEEAKKQGATEVKAPLMKSH